MIHKHNRLLILIINSINADHIIEKITIINKAVHSIILKI